MFERYIAHAEQDGFEGWIRRPRRHVLIFSIVGHVVFVLALGQASLSSNPRAGTASNAPVVTFFSSPPPLLAPTSGLMTDSEKPSVESMKPKGTKHRPSERPTNRSRSSLKSSSIASSPVDPRRKENVDREVDDDDDDDDERAKSEGEVHKGLDEAAASSAEGAVTDATSTAQGDHRDGLPGGTTDGVPGGAAGGVAGGVAGGISGSPMGSAGLAKIQPKKVPPHVLERERIREVHPVMPALVKDRYRGQTVRVTAVVCVLESGDVDMSTTRILSGVPGYDAAVLEAVRQWKYKSQPIPICAPVRFETEVID